MKRVRFSELFLLAAIIIFVASERNIYSSVLLVFASVYMIVDIVAKLRGGKDDAKR